MKNERCEYCGAGDDSHHSYTCPTGKHPNREFEPEYFSGLNWQDSKKFVGRKIEVSNDGDKWAGPFMLKGVSIYPVISRFELQSGRWTYIRTCPETYAHPTITISRVELPRPEVEALEEGTVYFFVDVYNNVCEYSWRWDATDISLLEAMKIHLTEPRAQAWADWWRDYVMAMVRGGE